MDASRQQAIQVAYALLYGESRVARDRLLAEAPPSFVTNLKRLLETDLANARTNQAPPHPARMAFYDALPAGTGHNVKYSPFRVFNLTVAHELARFGCKQGEVVEFLSAEQDELKRAFDKANREQQTSDRTRLPQGDAAESISSREDLPDRRKIYLVMRRIEATEAAVAYFGYAIKLGERLCQSDLLYGKAALDDFLSNELRDGLFGAYVIELSELAVRVTELIHAVPLRKRGRQPSHALPFEAPAERADVLKQARLPERGHGE